MRTRRAATWAACLAGGAVVLCSCAGTPAALLRSGSHGTPQAAHENHAATISADGQRSATLAVVSGATTVFVSAAAMPGTLIKVSTPGNSAVRPQLVQQAGQVELFLDNTGQSGPSAVLIQLSSAVAWHLQFSGGANQTVLSLRHGDVSSIDFTAGSSLISMTLPPPHGTIPITLAGGATQVSLTVPHGVPAQLRLYGGASTATLAGHTHVGLSGGTILAAPGWAAAPNRYDVDAPAGVSEISVAN
jgi:hypothetical protein